MRGIGGNIYGTVQVYTTTKNEIGEKVKTWADVQKIKGWLDMSAGEARHNTFHSKIQESTHIFIADYVELDKRITTETSRMVIGGFAYDVLLIDNPMGMMSGSQLEIYLRYTGGQ